MSDLPSISLSPSVAPSVAIVLPPVPSLTFYAVSVAPGGSSSAAGVSSLNALTGALTILGAGNVSVLLSGSSTIYVSGNNVGGAVTQSQLDSLSGWAASVTNLGLTGASLYALVTGLSGYNGQTYATIANVTQTGVILGARIDSLSGFVTGMSGYLASLVGTPNLSGYITTGQADLRYYPLLTNPSGYLNTLSGLSTGFVQTQVTGASGALQTQIALTGQAAIAALTGASGYLKTLIAGSVGGVSSINGQSGILTMVGAGNVSVTTGASTIIVSGDTGAYSTFATVINLAATGSALYNLVTGSSGILQTQINALPTAIQLAQTGSTLDSKINALSGFATGASGYNAVTYATITNLTQSGVTLGAKIDALSGWATGVSGALQSQINLTGQQSIAFANGIGSSLSGALTATGALLSAVKVTGSAIINVVNFTGLGGTLVFTSGAFVFVSGAAGGGGGITQAQLDSLSGFSTGFSGFLQTQINTTNANLTLSGATIEGQLNSLSGFTTGVSGFLRALIAGSVGGVSSINGQSGILTMVGAGNVTVTTGASTIIVSGDTGAYINFATVLNLAATGSTLDGKINSLSGFVTGQSGFNVATYATLTNLTLTGQSLGGRIDSLSGFTTGLSGFDAATYATKVSLNSLSGFTTGLSGYDASVYATIINLTQTGVTLGAKVDALSGFVTGLSGFGSSVYATIVNLTQTGVTLGAKIDALSGFVTGQSGFNVSTYATLANLTLTGQTLITRDNSLSGFVTGLSGYDATTYATITNLTQTGVTLGAKIDALSGFVTGQSGFNVSIYATQANLTQTGVTLGAKVDALSGFATGFSGSLQTQLNALTTNLTQTGVTLGSKIDSASGYAEGIYVHRSGNELVTGTKTFLSELRFNSGLKTPVRFFGPGNYSLISGDCMVIATGTLGSTTGILPSPSDYSGILFTLINGGTTSLQVSGIVGPDINPTLLPWDGYELYATSGQWWPIRQTGSQLLGMITALSGFVGNVSGALQTIIASTGQAAWTAAQNNATNLSGNLTLTGQTLIARDLATSGALDTRLTQTGVTLGGQLNALSGFTTGMSGALQTQINALPTATQLTQTGATLGGQINSLSGFTTGFSGALQVQINALPTATQLTQTGATLGGQINALSGFATGFSGANQVQINTLISNLTSTGALLSAVKITGSAIINVANFTGLGGTLVFSSGSFIFISGAAAGGGGGVTSLNAVAGALTLTGAGNVTVLANGVSPIITISGDTGAYANFATVIQLNSVSGWTTGISGALQSQIGNANLPPGIVFTTGNQNVGDIKFFNSGTFSGRLGIGTLTPLRPLHVIGTNEGVANFSSPNLLVNLVIGPTGGSGYWGSYTASNEAIPLWVDDWSGFFNGAFKFTKDYRSLGLLESNSTYLRFSTTTGSKTQPSYDNYTQDLILGVSTGRTGAFIQSAWQNVSYTPLFLQPNGGFVGINTFTPKNPLHVQTINAEPVLIENTDSASYSQILFGAAPNYRYQIGVAGVAVPSMSGKFYIYDAAAATFRLVLNSGGNFGIGTQDPKTPLHVTGIIRSDSTAQLGGLTLTGAINYNANFLTGTTTLDSTYTVIFATGLLPFTVTLPNPNTQAGRMYIVKNRASGILTVAGTIDGGLASLALSSGQSMTLISDTAVWNQI